MVETSTTIIFWVIILLRFIIPLTIIRYPLPGFLASVLLDAIDLTLFQILTDEFLSFYQGYDKALDIYFLTIAYIAMIRNWHNTFAFRVGQGLFYYRLVGIVLFESTHNHWLLFAFPNLFEFYFIFYEIVRVRWTPKNLGKRFITVATLILLIPKLFQEYVIHVARIIAVDWIKINVLGVTATTSVTTILAQQWHVLAATIAVITSALTLLWKKLPPAHHPVRFKVKKVQKKTSWQPVEKIILLSLIVTIFSQILPSDITLISIAIGVAFIVVINMSISQWVKKHKYEWKYPLHKYVSLSGINVLLILIYASLLPFFQPQTMILEAVFFALLLTLLIMLLDKAKD